MRRQVSTTQLFAAYLIGAWLLLAIWGLRLGEAQPMLWVVTAGVHYLLLPAWVVLVVALLKRRRALAVAAALTVVAQLPLLVPLFPGPSHHRSRGARIEVASWNSYIDNHRLPSAMSVLEARRGRTALPDVLVMQEYTPAAQHAFHAGGLPAFYRYRVERPVAGTVGMAAFSRFPIVREVVPRTDVDLLSVRVSLPGGQLLHVVDVHAFGPQTFDRHIWVRGLHQLDRVLDAVKGHWVALGDYNSTSDHRVFRDLLHDGRHDAHLATGRGYARTWPADAAVPPLVLIDHMVMSRRVAATGTGEWTLPGSDHRLIDVHLVLE